jgi:hypothetical protein
MNAIEKKIKARFARETRFAVAPKRAAVTAKNARGGELDRLKGRLLEEALREKAEPELGAALRRAANEAAALAWATWYPLLLFPELFEEKVRAAARHAERQAEIRQRSLAWL